MIQLGIARESDREQVDALLESSGMALDMRASHVVVAREGTYVVGVAAFHQPTQRLGWLTSVAVAKFHRRTGIGRQLVERIADYAETRGCSELWLETMFWNGQFYAALGHQPVQVDAVPEQIKSLRSNLRCCFFVRMLSNPAMACA